MGLDLEFALQNLRTKERELQVELSQSPGGV